MSDIEAKIDELISLLERQNEQDRKAIADLDSGFSPIGRWKPINEYRQDIHGSQILVCGGTVRYEPETFPSDMQLYGVTIATKRENGWWGGYGAECDGEFWLKPEYFQPIDKPVSALLQRTKGDAA